MPETKVDARTGARFYSRTEQEDREKRNHELVARKHEPLRHIDHQEMLLHAIFQVLTEKQQAEVRRILADCEHGCIRNFLGLPYLEPYQAPAAP